MLLYLYGITAVDAPEPPPELLGIDGGAVRLLRSGSVAGIVGEVETEAYSGDRLDTRLGDLGWVGERGIVHERVLTWFADRGPVIPLQPFSLHGSDSAVLDRLAAGEERFRRSLDRLTGKREWGVKVWALEAEVLEHLDEISPAMKELAEGIRRAAPGRRFLLTRKKAAIANEELRGTSRAVAQHVHGSLAELAEAAVRHSIPPPGPGEKFVILHAAYLVADDGYDVFQQRVSELSARFGRLGFSCEFTGPWPPYHFADA